MYKLWKVLYNIILLPAICVFFSIYALVNSKVRKGFYGRRDLFNKLSRSLSVFNESKNGNILIHCSSLGEYQQAIPLINEFSKLGFNVVVSFFSPSGYANSNISFNNCIKTYLPLDTIQSGELFLDMINPAFIVFMRYDLWMNLMDSAKRRDIPMYIANARFDKRDLTWTFPVLRSFKIELYGLLTGIFTIDKKDEQEYKKVLSGKNTKVYLIGDSKYERVKQAGEGISGVPELSDVISGNKKIFVIGSSWKEDENVLFPVIDKLLQFEPDLMTFLVPHEPKVKKIDIILKKIHSGFNNISPIRYSLIENFKNENLIIVDRIGLLMRLYSIAQVSYVGGGFKSGLHNILEPAIYNIPILFSNTVKNSDEDEILMNAGCGFAVSGQKDVYRLLRKFLSDSDYRRKVGENCRKVFIGSEGIAEKIVQIINQRNVR
ncbi:hypothetical protein FBQ84_01730 [Ignavibacteria bacterium CHB1]|nr:MAG: hypothetical protein EDM69_02185 [Chlorobiota bacterium]MBV6398044.1 3-deoxy-D-manno-octulosonic acid transferase [Ignavibacteria bacterium]MCC6886492.1 hypothetical protein [Ignavibacteriales bacterium]MCE7952432.1 hypothetical protein [Chlorobi bacterium CHB7]MDL1886549.1 hypothetical protein [Ignavibacteria bacterium CHB1]RIK48998.1 MAG: hypothetical protein DCC60_05315 [Ignavibacteriota bacterium]